MIFIAGVALGAAVVLLFTLAIGGAAEGRPRW